MRIRKKPGYFLVRLKVVQLYLFFWHQTGWRISVESELHLLHMYHRSVSVSRSRVFVMLLNFISCALTEFCFLFWFFLTSVFPEFPCLCLPLSSSSSLFVLGNLISCAFTSFLRLLSHIFRLHRLLLCFFVPLLLCLCYLCSNTIFWVIKFHHMATQFVSQSL